MRVMLHPHLLRRGLTFLAPLAFALQLACGGGGGGGTAPTPTPVVTVPVPPSSLVVAPGFAGTLALSWIDNATNESGYKIERSTGAGGPFAQIAITPANNVSYTDNGLNASTTYYYQIRATNSAGDSAYTAVAWATTSSMAVVPPAPSGLSATPATTSAINLYWTDNASNETSFKVDRGSSASGPFTQVGATPANVANYTDGSLSPSTTYYYRVRASNSAGDSANSAVASATTPAVLAIPAAPSGLTATAASAGSITLGWTDQSAGESGFKIERGTSVSGPFTQITLTAANAVSYTDTGLAASTAYSYRVRATNSAGDSAYTAVATATTASGVVLPAAPSNLVATVATLKSVSLVWTDNATNETGFKIERSTSASGPFALHATTSANTPAYLDQGLSPATTYYYQVRATNSAGDSAASAMASVTTPTSVTIPAAPTYLSAMATATTSIGLSWTDNSSDETGFKIERGTSVSGPFAQIQTVSANITNYADTGLSAGTTYSYRVRATNSAGDSPYTAVASASTPAAVTIPAAPSGLVATAASTSAINLAWTDNSSNETGFKIERSSSGSSYTLIGLTAANVNSYTDGSLSASTTYSYRVRATSSAGDSANTAVASATTKTPVSGSTTVTLYPTQDNLLLVSSWDSSYANTVNASAELAIGTNWIAFYDSYGDFLQTFLRAESVVQWDVSALSGKTIESATLTMNREYSGVNQHNWWIVALASPWSTSTVTYNTIHNSNFQHYNGNQLHLIPPSATTTTYDITPIVANWASGTFQNHGLWFTPDISLMPGVSENEAFAFYSRESGSSTTWAPMLTVVYH